MARKDKSKEQFKALDDLYARLPQVECKGLCWDACGPLRMTEVEYTRLARAHGGTVPPYDPIVGHCPFLTAEKRCQHYRERPFVCHLYGLTKRLSCEHGCEPERWLTDSQVAEFFLDLHRIAGGGEERWIMPEGWKQYLEEECPFPGEPQFTLTPYLEWKAKRKPTTNRNAAYAGSLTRDNGAKIITALLF